MRASVIKIFSFPWAELFPLRAPIAYQESTDDAAVCGAANRDGSEAGKFHGGGFFALP